MDQFGSPAVFNIGGQDSFKTCIGVLWSCVFFLALGVATVYYFYNYVTRAEPTIQTNLITLDEYPALDLSKDKFFISLVFRENRNFKSMDYF